MGLNIYVLTAVASLLLGDGKKVADRLRTAPLFVAGTLLFAPPASPSACQLSPSS